MSKKYFFRDLKHEDNLDGNKTFHAAGLVYGDVLESDSFSGKDLAVCFVNPFTGIVERQWRAFAEVELFKAEEHEHESLSEVLKQIESSY